MRRLFLLITIFLGSTLMLQAQQGSIGVGTNNPNPNAILHVVAPGNDQGFLLPRLTTAQRNASLFIDRLSASENGLLVYDTDENKVYVWIDTQWIAVNGASGQDNQVLSLSNTIVTLENGGSIDLAGFLDNTDDQQLTLTSNILSLESGGSVDLSGYMDNTDNQGLVLTNDVLTISGGTGSVNLLNYRDDADADPNNELELPVQTVAEAGYFLQADGVGNVSYATVNVNDADADPANEIQDLSLSGNILTITGNATATPIDLSPFTDTDNQQLTLTSNLLSLESGGSVDLSGYLDNTDNQGLVLTNDVLTISGGTGSVNLLNYRDDADADPNNEMELPAQSAADAGYFLQADGVGNVSYTAVNVNDADADPANEIQDLNLSGNILTITGNAAATPIDLSPFTNTDAQQLQLSGTSLSITNGNSVELNGLVYDQATEISVTPTGNLTSINVQSALEELQVDIDGLSSAGTTSFFSLHPSAYVQTSTSTSTPDDLIYLPNGQYVYLYYTPGTLGVGEAGTEIGSIIAPLNFTHGATLNQMLLYAEDSDGANDITVNVYKKAHSSNSSTLIGSGSSATLSGVGSISIPVSGEVIDNSLYTYYIVVGLHGYDTTILHKIFGLSVEFTKP